MPDPTFRVRFRRARVAYARRLFARSRTARTVLVLAAWPAVALADRLRGIHPAVSLRVGLEWARTGGAEYQPTIRTATTPAAVRRQNGADPHA